MNRHAIATDPTAARARASSGIGISGVKRAVQFLAAAASLITLASWLGSRFWLLELLTHFRLQLTAGAVVLAVAALLLRCRASFLAGVAVAAANLVPVWAYVLPGAIDVQAGPASARILSVNVNLRNRDYAAALALVEDENPDIAAFLEVDEMWSDALSALQATYPYSVLRPEEGAYGLALYSRYPLRELDASPYVQNGVQTAIMVAMEVQETPVTLTLAHLKAPTSPANAALRNLQLAALTEMIRADDGHEQIVVGDLNVTPWSPHYKQLEDGARLMNAARTRGYWPTWPTGINPLKIPIDHCLLSEGIQVQQFRTGAHVGSDHLPIVVDVTVAGAPASPPAT